MQSNHHRSSLLAAALVALPSLALLPACESKKEKTADTAAATATSFRRDLAMIPGKIDTTMQKLIAATSGQNPRRADDFREFQKSLNDLRTRARIVNAEAERAEAASSEYFRAWAKEANRVKPADRGEAIAEATAARQENYSRALSYLNNARRDYDRLLTSLLGIERTLAADFSEKATMSVQPLVDSAAIDAQKVRGSAEALISQIDSALAGR